MLRASSRERPHGDLRLRLIAETDPAGGVKRELIYLGDIPVAVVQ